MCLLDITLLHTTQPCLSKIVVFTLTQGYVSFHGGWIPCALMVELFYMPSPFQSLPNPGFSVQWRLHILRRHVCLLISTAPESQRVMNYFFLLKDHVQYEDFYSSPVDSGFLDHMRDRVRSLKSWWVYLELWSWNIYWFLYLLLIPSKDEMFDTHRVSVMASDFIQKQRAL